MSNNRAVIYSNGIADFRRVYQVQGATKIDIPVKQQHVADVLASLHVLGDVTLTSPPTFRPANEADGTLTWDVRDALLGIARSLAGADAKIEHDETFECRLVGTHTDRVKTADGVVERHAIVFMRDGKLVSLPLSEVRSIEFQDESIQAELDKALQRQLEQTKPSSTLIALEVSSETNAEAFVQYTVPAAAWKISYRLRRVDDERFSLQGYAIVDNNTDDDWKEVELAVVTGEPITFSTDLAESKTPHRRHVNVVRDEALGAVEPEVVMMAAAPMAGGAAEFAEMDGMAEDSGVRRKLSRARGAGKPARMETGEAEDTGDFCIFHAPRLVSIDSNRSAVIPVFSADLGRAQTVIHYDVKNHATRPFRAIQFFNETGHSLGRGVCTVFEEDVYGGSCVMPASKPDEESLLPHALEMGVRVRRDAHRHQSRRTQIAISKGVLVDTFSKRQTTEYRIQSSRDDECTMFVDHAFGLPEPAIVASLQRGADTEPLDTSHSLATGRRLSFQLPPRASVVVSVEEKSVGRTQVILRGDRNHHQHWLRAAGISENGPLANHEGLQMCQQIQAEWDQQEHVRQQLEEEATKLTQRQERLRKNVTAAANASQTSKWLGDLDQAEQRLVEIEETLLPACKQLLHEIGQRLEEALQKISIEWSAPSQQGQQG